MSEKTIRVSIPTVKLKPARGSLEPCEAIPDPRGALDHLLDYAKELGFDLSLKLSYVITGAAKYPPESKSMDDLTAAGEYAKACRANLLQAAATLGIPLEIGEVNLEPGKTVLRDRQIAMTEVPGFDPASEGGEKTVIVEIDDGGEEIELADAPDHAPGPDGVTGIIDIANPVTA